MSSGPIHPLAGSLAASYSREAQTADRTKRAVRSKPPAKLGLLEADIFERQVEDPQAVDGVDPETEDRLPRKKKTPREEEEAEERLDLEA